MKNILFLILVISMPGYTIAQLHNNGGTVKVTPGAVLYSDGDVTNTGGGQLSNAGTLSTPGSITNSNAATLSGDGQYTLSGDWTNSATFSAGMSTVTFNGSSDSNLDAGGDDFYQLEPDKTAANIILAGNLTITHLLNFASDNNKIILGAFDLTLGASATITGDDENDYIVAGGTGRLLKNGIGTTPFLFCIGFDENTPNPITLVQSGSGTVDNFGVRVLQNALAEGSSGAVLTRDVVNVSWFISEAVAGGSDLTLTTQWAATDELTGFDRTDCGVSRYVGPHWDLTNADAGPSAGTDPYTRQRSGFAEVGYFAVGGEAVMDYISVSPKVFLQGPFSGTMMTDQLRSQSLLPTDEPYAALTGFTHAGRGGGEQVNASVFTPTGDDAITDWVFLELRDKNASGTVLETRSALIQRDGDIVDTDGLSEVKFRGLTGDDHYLAVRHRNHLGVRTPAVLTLARTTTAYDFTTSMSQAHGSNPMIELTTGLFGLWAGNATADDKVRFQGADNDSDAVKNDILGHPGNFFNLLTFSYSAYDQADHNLDGAIKYQGADNDSDLIKNNILSHPGNFFNLLTFTIQEQLP